MDKQSVIYFLKCLASPPTQVRDDWVTAHCPLAPWTHTKRRDTRPSFAIRCSPDAESFYNCYTCGSGDLLSLVRALHDHGAARPKYDMKTAVKLATADGDRPLVFNVKDWGEMPEEPYVTFPEPWLATFMPVAASPRAMRYLATRKGTPYLWERLDLRYDSDVNAICFPVRDFDGVLCGLRGRRLAPADDQPRYHIYRTAKRNHNRVVWYGEPWIDFDKPIVMCESVFDVASVLRVYANVCAPMTSGFSKVRAQRMKAAIEIVTLFDEDSGGDKARQRVDKYLRKARVTHLHPPDGLDPGEMTKSELRATLRNHVNLKE